MDDGQSTPKNTLWERERQLRLWDASETNTASSAPRDRQVATVKFHDGCVFLAACSSGDTKEIVWLLGRGADINTANVDGLTALHQACIDDNLPMVRFLVEHGADIEVCDNEGWTALHATASCGFVDIARYLVDKGARLDAVNNDGELAIDLAEGKQMEVMLSNAMEKQGIDAEAARKEEEEIMLRDTNQWLNCGCYSEQPHPKTGAMAMHVAAAKGYIKVIKLLLEAGADVNAVDFDGWTPLHAAAHWGQDEACKILSDNFGNLAAVTNAGQTPLDLADPDVEMLLVELKKKQDLIKKDMENRNKNSDLIREISPGKYGPRRSSITRLSVDQRQILAQKNAEDERAHLHSVLGQVSEDVVTEVEVESETGPWKADAVSDSNPAPPECSKSPTDVTSETVLKQENGDEPVNGQSSKSPQPVVNGMPTSNIKTEEKPKVNELSNVETDLPVDNSSKPAAAVDEQVAAPVSTAVGNINSTETSPLSTSTSSTTTSKLAVIGRQSAIAGQKTVVDPVSTATTSSTPSVVSQTMPAASAVPASRIDDAPATWRAGLRKTGSADIVCPPSMTERSDGDKLSRSSSVSWGPPGRANTISEVSSLRRTGSAVGSDADTKEQKPRVESPAFQQQLSQPAANDRVTDLYARYKAQLMGRTSAPTPSNGFVLSSRPNTPISTSTVSNRTTPMVSSTATAQQSSRQLPSVQWLRRQKPEQDANSEEQSRSSTIGGISRRTIDLLKRDEEKEVERKARAKRARESRRSTQGVTKEDLEKAGASLQAAAATAVVIEEPAPVPVTSTVDQLSTSSRSMSLTDEDDPLRSYRKSRESSSFNDGNSTFTTGFMRSLRDAGLAAALANSTSASTPKSAVAPSSSLPVGVMSTAASSNSSSGVAVSTDSDSTAAPVVTTSAHAVVRATAENSLPGNSSEDGDDGAVMSAAARARRRRENRRPASQGVSQDISSLSVPSSTKSDDTTIAPGNDQSVIMRANRLPVTCLAVTGCSYSLPTATTSANQSPSTVTTSTSTDNGNGFKKLYEQEQQCTERLRNELREVRRELSDKSTELERVREAAAGSSLASTRLSTEATTERREKRALERKISELEEELKELQSLRTENQRLRDENGALIRVISKLSK